MLNIENTLQGNCVVTTEHAQLQHNESKNIGVEIRCNSNRGANIGVETAVVVKTPCKTFVKEKTHKDLTGMTFCEPEGKELLAGYGIDVNAKTTPFRFRALSSLARHIRTRSSLVNEGAHSTTPKLSQDTTTMCNTVLFPRCCLLLARDALPKSEVKTTP